MKIIAETTTLYSPEEGKEIGLTVIPTCTIIDGKPYRDFEDIDREEFLEIIAKGAAPKTSQPALGDILELFEESNGETLFLPIGDGLSGSYQSAMGARNCMEENDHIHVLDTKTLAGAQRYIAKKALTLKNEGLPMEKIKEELSKSIASSQSYVIPEDFDFLKRSGRLTPIAAKIATVIKIVPVLTLTEDRKKITLFTVKRSKRKALAAVIEGLKELGVSKEYLLTVSHSGNVAEAQTVADRLKEEFAGTEVEVYALTPSLMTHGGPGCIVIQAIQL